jgi:hypothetical protein
MVRVLRVLRVFRLFRVGRRLHSEVQGRLLMLAATMFALTVTAAAFFYEIETRFGVSVLPELCYRYTPPSGVAGCLQVKLLMGERRAQPAALVAWRRAWPAWIAATP